MNDSERELLKAWLEAAGADGPDHDYQERERQEFLRTLNVVKAKAWWEGYLDGWIDTRHDEPFDIPTRTRKKRNTND